MVTRALIAASCTLVLGLAPDVRADGPGPTESAGDSSVDVSGLIGFWTVDLDGMGKDPQFKSTLDSEQGRAGLAYAEGVLFEFTADHRVRTQMGGVDDRPATITPAGDGAVKIQPQGATAWIITPISHDAFIQTFPEVDYKILWRRSWGPFVGTWRVATSELEEHEAWFRKLDEQERAALGDEIKALRVTVDPKGSVTGHWDGADRHATLKLESTTPPAAGVVEPGESKTGVHLVRSDQGAALYVGDRIWPMAREHPPSEVVVGDWKFDADRAKTMDWLKRSVPEGKTLDQYLKENARLDTIIPVTATEWNNQAYTVVDERANQFAAQANGRIVFWIRVVDHDHLLQYVGGGRVFPLKRAETGEK